MEKVITLNITYKQAHMMIAGAGGLIHMMGPPPETIMGTLRALGDFTKVLDGDPAYHVERANETFDLNVNEEQLDALVSCSACMHAMIRADRLSDCPHTEAESEALGLWLDEQLGTLRVRGD